MQVLRHPLAAVAPGVAALVLAVLALGRDGGERRVEVRTVAVRLGAQPAR